MGDLLKVLHKSGVGKVMLFSLNEPTHPANVTQVVRAAEEEKKDNDTSSIASKTICNPTEINVAVPLKRV